MSQEVISELKDSKHAEEQDLSSLGSPSTVDTKKHSTLPTYDHGDDVVYSSPPQTASDLVTEVIKAQDDPSLSPWTFRMWFLGMLMIRILLNIANKHERTGIVHLWRHTR